MSQPGERANRLTAELFFNAVRAVTRKEKPFRYTGAPDDKDAEVSDAVRRSLTSGHPVRLVWRCEKHDILSGVGRFLRDLDEEIAVVAWSTDGDPPCYEYILAARGSGSEVTAPLKDFVAAITPRLRAGVVTKALVLHNHPDHWLRDLIGRTLGSPPGPSTSDRRVKKELERLKPLLKAKCFVYESRQWRQFDAFSVDDFMLSLESL